MKKMLFSLAIITMAFTSCDLLDSVDDVEFNSDFTATYDVVATGDSVKLEQVIKLADDADIEKYKDKLQKVTVDSLVLTTENYLGANGNKLNGSFKYSETTSTSPILFAEISDYALANGAKTKLALSAAQLATVQNIMLTKKEIKVYLRGKTTSAATFKLKAIVYVSVTADALK